MNKIQKSDQTSLITKRGEIWLVEFVKTKEDRKPSRPCLVISNDIQNELDRLIIVVGMTTEDVDYIQPYEVFINNTPETGLDYPSKIQFNYPRTVDKERLKQRLGVASPELMERAKIAWQIALDWD